jgi:4-amino-4-deoxy-L-arabinose transferase-like glycosyltransferase
MTISGQTTKNGPEAVSERDWLIWPVYLLLALLFVYSHSGVAIGQFSGEDEVLRMRTSLYIINSLQHPYNLMAHKDTIYNLSTVNQPPLRFLVITVGLLFLPMSEFALRFGAMLFSGLMVYLTLRLGTELGGRTVGLCSAFFVAASGVFNWTSMAFSWSVIVCCFLQMSRIFNRGSYHASHPRFYKDYLLINLLIFTAFLINTGVATVFAGCVLWHLVGNRRQGLKVLAFILSPGLLYALYYLYFFVFVPFAIGDFDGTFVVYGQLKQTLYRSGGAHLNYESFFNNLKELNAYYLPFVSWILLICSLVQLFLRKRPEFIAFSLYALIWSFYLANSTGQYFLLFYTALVPFGIWCLHERLKGKRLIYLTVGLCVLMMVWNYFLFLKPYKPQTYPKWLIDTAWAKTTRRHNIRRPYRQMGRDLDQVLSKDGKFLHDLSGCFTAYYYTDSGPSYPHSKFAGALGRGQNDTVYDEDRGCYIWRPMAGSKVQAIVSQKKLCDDQVRLVKEYELTGIRLYEVTPKP